MADVDRLVELLARHGLPLPDARADDDAGPVVTWNAPLTPEQGALVAELRAMTRVGITDLGAYRAVKDDAAIALAFLELATPTNAQSVAALRAVIRIVRYMIARGAAG